MKILKSHKKKSFAFQNQVREQVAVDKTIIADIVDFIGDDFIAYFNEIDYARGFDVYSKISIKVYISGLEVLPQNIKSIEFNKDNIILKFDNKDGYFNGHPKEAVMIKGKFVDSYLVAEDDIWLDTEDYKDIIF